MSELINECATKEEVAELTEGMVRDEISRMENIIRSLAQELYEGADEDYYNEVIDNIVGQEERTAYGI